jgi:hypothetical protein
MKNLKETSKTCEKKASCCQWTQIKKKMTKKRENMDEKTKH